MKKQKIIHLKQYQIINIKYLVGGGSNQSPNNTGTGAINRNFVL